MSTAICGIIKDSSIAVTMLLDVVICMFQVAL